jgi:hypothetical protein
MATGTEKLGNNILDSVNPNVTEWRKKRFVTLRELMEELQLQSLIAFSEFVGQINGIVKVLLSEAKVQNNYYTYLNTPLKDITDKDTQSAIDDLIAVTNVVSEHYRSIGLTMSNMALGRLIDLINSPKVTLSSLSEQCRDFLSRLKDETESVSVFTVKSNMQWLATGEQFFGLRVAGAFPSAESDIDNAGKCLAFERWTASVFHSMRVLEIGLNTLAVRFNVPFADKNWQNIIDQIEAEIRKIAQAGRQQGTNWKEEEHFYSEAALQFRYFKNAWRNYVMHIRENYDEERATSIFVHVKGFMKHISQKLSE